MIRKKVKHIYFKSFIDNADIINTHNYFTSYSEFFIMKKYGTTPLKTRIMNKIVKLIISIAGGQALTPDWTYYADYSERRAA